MDKPISKKIYKKILLLILLREIKCKNIFIKLMDNLYKYQTLMKMLNFIKLISSKALGIGNMDIYLQVNHLIRTLIVFMLNKIMKKVLAKLDQFNRMLYILRMKKENN